MKGRCQVSGLRCQHEIIDVFCHCLPAAFCDAALRAATSPLHMLRRARAIPVMSDVGARLALMDEFPGYRQIPTVASPPIEFIAGPEATPSLARIANDELASMVSDHRDRFPGFVASLPMSNPEAACEEAVRAVKSLGACGVQMFTNVNGRPLDDAAFAPLFELMAELRRPIWLHPARGMKHPDYVTEDASKYELWWALGWPYETSVAMARLAFAGVFERWPDLKIITHHVGGMIPMMEGRFGPGMELFGTRTPADQSHLVAAELRERPVDALRRFYADTASFGSKAAIECGLAFFGADKLLFASDMPFDPERGPGYIRETLRAIDEMQLSHEERSQILSGNARRLLGIGCDKEQHA